MVSKRLWRAGSLAVVAGAVLTIVASYSGNSPTWDEPTRIAASLEWIQKGNYALQTFADARRENWDGYAAQEP